MKKQQQGLFDLLRNVSIRLPLLIFGTATDFDESIRLAEFVDKVDAASWQEFMPKEVDKTLFLKLLVFYDEDVIEGAGMRIRRMAKAADELMPTQRVMKIAEIFSYFKNPAKETVLNPWRVVNMHMGDTIGGYNFYQENYPMQDGVLEKPRLIEQGSVTSDLFLNEGDALQKKTEKAQESWAKKGQNLEYEAAKLQEKYQKGLITTANAQAEQQKLEQRAASLQQAQQKEAQALEEENFVFTNRAQDLLRRAVEAVNADRRYKLIINATALIDADTTLNISKEVLAKVNELYKAEQAEKK